LSVYDEDVSVLEEHETSPGLLLALLGYGAMRRLRAAHDAHGLKPRQFQILGLLERGGLGQRELGERMELDPSVVVGLLNPLEDGGFVARDRDPADRRRHTVSLTPAGVERLKAAADAQRAVEDQIFAALTAAQREQLRTLLLTLRQPSADCS
jgi:DNA-binding MarR family transcriptional regulator